MRQFDIVIEAVLDGRPGGELRFRPETQNGGGEDVGAGMADAFQLGHGRALMGMRHVGGGNVFGSTQFIGHNGKRFLDFARNDRGNLAI